MWRLILILRLAFSRSDWILWLGIPIFRIKVAVMEMEWSGNIGTETGIPFSISRTYSGTFWKLEIVPETGKIPEHFLEARIITEHIPETRKIPENVSETEKIPEQTCSGNRKTFRNTFWKPENFRHASRNGTKNLLTILDVVRDWMWILVVEGSDLFVYQHFRSDSWTILWILKCVSFYMYSTFYSLLQTNFSRRKWETKKSALANMEILQTWPIRL